MGVQRKEETDLKSCHWNNEAANLSCSDKAFLHQRYPQFY
jgi:hypothetical protein